MLSRRILRWRLAPPFPSPFPLLSASRHVIKFVVVGGWVSGGGGGGVLCGKSRMKGSHGPSPPVNNVARVAVLDFLSFVDSINSSADVTCVARPAFIYNEYRIGKVPPLPAPLLTTTTTTTAH